MLARASADPETIQGAVNKLGECYAAVPLNAPKVETIKAKRQPYRLGEVPREVMRLVAGVDVGKNDLWYVIRGFGARGASWLVERGRLLGPTDGEDIWDDLADAADLDQYGGMHVQKAMVDSGLPAGSAGRRRGPPGLRLRAPVQLAGHPDQGACHAHHPADGGQARGDAQGQGGRVLGRPGHGGHGLLQVPGHQPDRSRTNGRPGSFHLPQDIDDEYCRHMISEARRT
jgi:hypothetical protein